MAERLKTKLIEREKAVDIVCGPDAYKDLPRLLDVTSTGQAAGEYICTSFEFTQTLSPTYMEVNQTVLTDQRESSLLSIKNLQLATLILWWLFLLRNVFCSCTYLDIFKISTKLVKSG